MKKIKNHSSLSRFLFLLYCGAMLWLLFGQRWGETSAIANFHLNVNLIPLRTIRQYLGLLYNEVYFLHAVVNLVGNVVMFIPLGFLLPRIWQKFRNFFRTFFMIAAMVIVVELLQYFTLLGSMDIDDLILNLSGATVGYIGWKIYSHNRL